MATLRCSDAGAKDATRAARCLFHLSTEALSYLFAIYLIGLVVKGEKKAGAYKWYLASLLPDRKRGEGYIPPPKPVDDGHGHAH